MKIVPLRAFTAIAVLMFILPGCLMAQAQESLKQMRSNVIEKIDGKDYYIHTIKKGQTLYMISKAYGADVNEVIRENPEVKEGINAGQKIKIPVPKTEEPVKKSVKPNAPRPKEQAEPAPPEPAPEPAPEVQLPCGDDKSAKRDVYNVALMIPLCLNEVVQMNVETPPANPEETYNPLKFIQFYEGFRIAADSLQKSGTAFHVYVYDAVKDTVATRKILRNPEIKKMDLVIGLVYQRNFQMISSFCQKNSIPVVNPISERDQITDGNPFVFKAMPSLKSQVPDLVSFIKRSDTLPNVIICRDVQFKDTREPEFLRKILADSAVNVHLIDGYGKAFELFSKEKENLLVVFSDNKVFALEMLTKLYEFRNAYKLSIIGLPHWDDMDGLEPEHLVNLNVHMMAPSCIDYNDPEVKKFITRFQESYKTDPDLLAFQGFDITFYFFSALARYGKTISRCIPGFQIKSLQNDYSFDHTDGNGYINRNWEIYNFRNYTINRVTENN